MTELQKKWFTLLTKDRQDSARTLEKASMRGVQRSVVDKYSDQAHFIYELLQNADDAGATTAHFQLMEDGLFFHHNGIVHFTISDPVQEARDTEDGKLGHINAITSIANSNKNESSIGKFGVGFKAVFQYTATPHIYDPQIHFKIERFIVPIILESDLPNRAKDETIFYFPFDHFQKTPEESYADISQKLKSLDFPTLFLSSLQKMTFRIGEIEGKYTKSVIKGIKHKRLQVQLLQLGLDIDGAKTKQHLLLFTLKGQTSLPFSIGYGIDLKGRLMPIKRTAYCFFPTKESTQLNFILHAPFLLTDSREGIKAGNRHNTQMIQNLANLAAESLDVLKSEKLIDDQIFDLIPYDESAFDDADNLNRISFKPFYDRFKEKLRSGNYLPGIDGECAGKQNAFWASDTDLVELFSDQQLSVLSGIPNALWILRSLGKKEVAVSDSELADYIDGGDARAWARKEPNLIFASYDPEAILRKIDGRFIARQSIQWLHRFYEYLQERSSYQKIVKNKPIFLDQHRQPVAAYDENNELVLFLPDSDIEGYTTVHRELLQNKGTFDFITSIGVARPSLRHEIYHKILPAYASNARIETSTHFAKFFRFFKECKHEEVDGFIELIKDQSFLHYTTVADDTIYRGSADTIYLPTEELYAWFLSAPETRFLSLDHYLELVDEDDHNRLMEFFQVLGVAKRPRILKLGSTSWNGRTNLSNNDTAIDGLDSLMSKMNETKSTLVWSMFCDNWHFFSDAMKVFRHQYGPRGGHQGYKDCDTKTSLTLRSNRWILNKEGKLCNAAAISIQELSESYDVTSRGALEFIKFLELHDEKEDTAHLSQDELRKIKLAEVIESSGLSEEEIRQALEEAKRKKTASEQPEEKLPSHPNARPTESPIIRDILDRRTNLSNSDGRTDENQISNTAASDKVEIEDHDEFIPRRVDFGSKIEKAKDRCASELNQLERQQILHDKANEHFRYSYGWFLAMLELECMANEESSGGKKPISISFGKIEKDGLSARHIVLKQPNRFIPQSIEELSGVRLDLVLTDGRTTKARVESFTAREFSLHAKLESTQDLDEIHLNEVVEVRIDVKSPAFLLQELYDRFQELHLDEAYDMHSNLTPDIDFVFGPPGTGKTTHLVEKVLIPRMKSSEDRKILVLAPTNKAADVLTGRILDLMGDDHSYRKWLIRFGTTADERIEAAGVWRDRNFNMAALERSVTITTIARFPYDGYSGYDGEKLHEIEWDTIVIDEASMIPLAAIIYPLFHSKPKKFIIAGDPFQIEPIVTLDQWKEENIYSFVGLSKAGSFSHPKTVPHDYHIFNLDTQYRSVPAIGEVFSRFSYDGRLKHHRSHADRRFFNFGGYEPNALNLIHFPVSKYESIYRARKLDNKTPYQTYSALFTFELIRWMVDQYDANAAGPLRIGVIAPYRAQANILSRLIDSWHSRNQNVTIQVGTIHGFQGDECDIVFAVFNTPPSISSDSRMFLNKRNILNVAVSRARDCLFLVVPDHHTVDREKLRQINTLESIIKSSGQYDAIHSREIENLIWGQENYLEENTHSTGHQMVNVYRKPERYYEVRTDDSAVDVQIHET